MASMAICASILTANAATITPKTPPITIDADNVNQISKSIMKAEGHVIIKIGETEIKADKAKIITRKNKITVYIDTVIASAKT